MSYLIAQDSVSLISTMEMWKIGLLTYCMVTCIINSSLEAPPPFVIWKKLIFGEESPGMVQSLPRNVVNVPCRKCYTKIKNGCRRIPNFC